MNGKIIWNFIIDAVQKDQKILFILGPYKLINCYDV